MHHLQETFKHLIQPHDTIPASVFEALNDQFWLLNLHNPQERWFSNPIWTSLGYTVSENGNAELSRLDFIHANDLEQLVKLALEDAQNQTKTSHLVRCRHKNGSLVWWKCSGFVWEEAGAGIKLLVVSNTDITEEKKKEVSTMHLNKSLRSLLFGLGDLVFVVDRNFIVTHYSQNRDSELLFTLPSQFVNKHLKEIGLSDDELRNFIISIHESKEEGRIPEVDFRLTVNGKVEFYTGKVSSVKDENGQVLETIFIATNVTEKRLEEFKLQELALVGAKTTDLTIITDPFCQITWVNQAFEDHTGYRLDEIRGKDPASFLHGPETDPVKKEMVQDAIRRKIPVKDTIVNYTKDGRKYWVDFRIDPVFNEVGMCSHFISIERDVTERKKAEEELEQTRAYLLETNRVGKVGGWSYDVAADQVFWTDVTREIHELPRDFEPTVEKVIQFYKEGESRQKYFEVGTRALREGIPYDEELQIVTAKGRELWVRAIGKVEFKNGVCTRLYGTFQDIDSFKKAEKELKESSALLKNLTDHVPGCLYQYEILNNGEIRVPYVSWGVLGITGYSSEEVRKDPSLILAGIHPEDLPGVQKEIQSSFESLNQWECDYRICMKSGGIKWVRGISRPQKFEDGVQWFGFMQEIPESQVRR